MSAYEGILMHFTHLANKYVDTVELRFLLGSGFYLTWSGWQERISLFM